MQLNPKAIFLAALVCLALSPAPSRAAGKCEFPNKRTTDLVVRDGYTDWIPAAELKPFKDALPEVANAEAQAILKSPDTMWYDEDSMVFLYQDSVEVVVGGRANCVGRKVGEKNISNPGIAKLLNLFGDDYRFMFPFRKVAGTDNADNVKSLNFWAPPKQNGAVLPVKYWRATKRERWNWTFPLGTVFGEVLYEQAPDGHWYVFEVRTRKRYQDGWEVSLYRPFLTAESLAKAIISRRPAWRSAPNLQAYVKHLRDKGTLVQNRWESKPFGKVFPAIDGALDPVPDLKDAALVAELLTRTPFISAEGAIWKENGSLETYAPSSQADFNIVPKNYEIGMIPVNEVSCNRCHTETGRKLGEFEFDAILYGEVWGEERIFTWHLFEPNQYIYDTWDDADVPSRKLNPRLAEAKLVESGKPSGDANYNPLPSAYVPESGKKRR